MSELSEHLAQDPPDFEVETFIVDNDQKAEWALRKLKAAIERLDDINAQAVEEIAKVENWRALVSTSHKRDVTFFENLLKHYMLSLREADPEKKSLVLPDGEVTSRSIPEKAEVSDKELFFKYCHENGRELWIRTKEEPDLTSLKDGVSFSGDAVVDDLTGESIPGLVGIEAHISVKVSTT
jgi:hypothetical protein